LKIQQLLAGPNPNPNFVSLDLAGPADEIEMRVYTKAMQCVASRSYAPAGAGWVQEPWPMDGPVPSNGLYYLTAVARRGGVESATMVTKVLVLR
jgi:hypothetical protein